MNHDRVLMHLKVFNALALTVASMNPVTVAVPSATIAPYVLDTRPLFAQGESPCQAIEEATATLTPGQPLVLLVPFEPVPLYTRLGKQGFTHQAERLVDGTWRVEFRR